VTETARSAKSSSDTASIDRPIRKTSAAPAIGTRQSTPVVEPTSAALRAEAMAMFKAIVEHLQGGRSVS